MLEKTPPKTRAKKQVATLQERQVVIKPPKFEVATVHIRGASPYVQHAFSQKAIDTMMATQKQGHQSRKGKAREPKDFDAAYEGAKHKSRQGWLGIPASAFRSGMISACRTVGYKMTLAKLSLFVEADGFGNDGTPLVRITKGTPHMDIRPVRIALGTTDLRARPMWNEGWEANLRIRWDAEQFSATDVFNLLARVGLQVGIGEGRPDSPSSEGQGWGFFEIITK
jgi:hypothetical protein